ncbi:MAG TPA: hypothetical protein VHR72_05720 [Gemmataceae bacterium]|jgi:hypothetical protein|nr:hypothetical protein [Gemmataceae bacterium]
MLDFRWIAGIALWTLLIGPVMDFGANRTPIRARVSQVQER